MSFEVLLTDDAVRDLNELHDYISTHDAPAKADRVLKQIEAAFQSLSKFPERGNCPPELLDVGIRDFRERFFKPYRIIYRVIGTHVYVMLIADGRRDMQSLLERRMLSG